MPRASRHYIPGCVWHITHRCHKGEFLLKFARDRRCWMRWLFEAKKRYGMSILNYMVTSNHIHLLVRDNGGKDTIARSIQLIASRTGQEFNQRKKRKGAFWEDRYHATAVESDKHLVQCLVYIDLNMVRAGVSAHPADWPFCGYSELQAPRQRYALTDYNGLRELLSIRRLSDVAKARSKWVDATLEKKGCMRDAKWTESVAVGSEGFVKKIKNGLGLRARGRRIIGGDDSFVLREHRSPYNGYLKGENT